MNIAVLCSQNDVAEKYKEAAESLAALIGKGGHTLVWGGTNEGLMGIMGRGAQKGGSRLVGIMHERIKHKAFTGADEITVVPNAYEMNLGLINRADVILALPGGIGTLNEMTEVLRMRKNGFHKKPVVFVSTDGFYSGLQHQLQKMADEGFLSRDIIDSVSFSETADSAMSAAIETSSKAAASA